MGTLGTGTLSQDHGPSICTIPNTQQIRSSIILLIASFNHPTAQSFLLVQRLTDVHPPNVAPSGGQKDHNLLCVWDGAKGWAMVLLLFLRHHQAM